MFIIAATLLLAAFHHDVANAVVRWIGTAALWLLTGGRRRPRGYAEPSADPAVGCLTIIVVAVAVALIRRALE